MCECPIIFWRTKKQKQKRKEKESKKEEEEENEERLTHICILFFWAAAFAIIAPQMIVAVVWFAHVVYKGKRHKGEKKED